MKAARLFLIASALVVWLAACDRPTPTATSLPQPTATQRPTTEPTALPTERPSATFTPVPQLDVALTTDSPHYEPPKIELRLTVTNHEAEPIYLPVCGPWRVVEADTLRTIWTIECEIDYLGHKIEPGESFSGSLPQFLQEGSYRVATEVYGNCALGESKTISARETYYGEFYDCAIRETVYSDPFGVE